MTVFEIVA